MRNRSLNKASKFFEIGGVAIAFYFTSRRVTEEGYKVTLEDNKLFVNVKGYPPFHLRSIGQDLFLAENDRFEFIRDENNLIIGFDRCGNRVRRIHFIKQ